jgi:hypothetical protein
MRVMGWEEGEEDERGGTEGGGRGEGGTGGKMKGDLCVQLLKNIKTQKGKRNINQKPRNLFVLYLHHFHSFSICVCARIRIYNIYITNSSLCAYRAPW